MASVVFSTVGQALGGPLGAAVGAAVGGSIDGALFGRRGPAGSSDLLVQRSAYGEALPRLFGRSRAAGVLIWALPMTAGGGKGSGRRGTSMSFAVALSSGPIRGIGRIWADGREIRDAQGRFETATNFRVYTGSGRQAPDPLIVAAEGIGLAPAYRGLAYVVFEDLSLGAFGNRIPNLSFEVDADPDGPGHWLGSLLGRVALETDAASEPQEAVGYGAAAARLADDVEVLARVADAGISYPQGSLRFARGSRLFEIPLDDVAALEGARRAPAQRSRAEALRPASLSIDYLDPDRDYQAGRQRVDRNRAGEPAVASAPLVATASQAKALAQLWLRKAESAIDSLEITLGWKWLDVGVGDVIALVGRAERWRVVRRDVRGLLVHLQAALLPDGTVAATASDPGRALPAPAAIAPPTRLIPFETPVPLQPGPPVISIAANGDAGWRSAVVSRLEAGAGIVVGEIRGANPTGILAQPLESGSELLWDGLNEVDLVVAAGTEPFESRSSEAVLAGANLVRIDNELLQFREAQLIGEGRVRLSGLLRGRFGTGYAGLRHEAGARVEMLRIDRILSLPIAVDSAGARIIFLAEGRGDAAGGVESTLEVQGLGFGPLAPCHVRAERTADGTIRSDWIARARTLFDWGSTQVAPTRFLWRFLGPGGFRFERDVSGETFVLSVADQEAAYGAVFPAGMIEIEALGEGPLAMRLAAPVGI